MTFSVALAFIVTNARAEAPTLAGRWSATALRADWNIGDWGPACGPKPGGGGAAGGIVTITKSGSELSMSFPGRTFSTAECWEQYPGLVRTSHTAGARAFRSVCKTGAGDPRQATVVTTLSATDNQISFDETGQYQFVIQGQNCTASVRRTRSLTLLQREGEPEAKQPSAAASAPIKKPAPIPRCAQTGLPERLEVRPSRKLMRPGESFEFRAAVVDAAGCPLPIAPVWSKASGAALVELSGPGKVTAREDASEGEARLQATVADRSVAVIVEVVSRERYDALLQQGSFNAEGESSEAAVARIASSSIGARTTVARDVAQGKRVAFVAVVGVLALALGIVGLLVVFRGKRKPAKSRAPVSFGSARASAAGPGANVCPTCREEFPGTAEFCAFDGNRLIPQTPGSAMAPTGGVCPVCGQGYDPGVTACPKHQEPLVPALVVAERRRAIVMSQKICPVCGTQFPGDSQFCGKCGAALVPVN